MRRFLYHFRFWYISGDTSFVSKWAVCSVGSSYPSGYHVGGQRARTFLILAEVNDAPELGGPVTSMSKVIDWWRIYPFRPITIFGRYKMVNKAIIGWYRYSAKADKYWLIRRWQKKVLREPVSGLGHTFVAISVQCLPALKLVQSTSSYLSLPVQNSECAIIS